MYVLCIDQQLYVHMYVCWHTYTWASVTTRRFLRVFMAGCKKAKAVLARSPVMVVVWKQEANPIIVPAL